MEYGCSNTFPFYRDQVSTPPQRLPSCPEDANWYAKFERDIPKQLKSAGIVLDDTKLDISSVVGGGGKLSLAKSPFNEKDLNVKSPEQLKVLEGQVDETVPDIHHQDTVDFVSVIDNMPEKHVSKSVVLLFAEGILAFATSAPTTVISWFTDYFNINKLSTKDWNDQMSERLDKGFTNTVDVDFETITDLLSGKGYKPSDLHEDKWDEWCNLLKQYAAQKGKSVNVPWEEEFKGKKLGNWVGKQRYLNHLGLLDERRTQRLVDMNFVWNHSDDYFGRCLQATQEFVNTRGYYPSNRETKGDDYDLDIGEWWSNQLKLHRKNELGDAKLKRLEDLPKGGIRNPYRKNEKEFDDKVKEYIEWADVNGGKPRAGIPKQGSKPKRNLNQSEMTEEQLEETQLGSWAAKAKSRTGARNKMQLVKAGILGFDTLNASLARGENEQEEGKSSKKRRSAGGK